MLFIISYMVLYDIICSPVPVLGVTRLGGFFRADLERWRCEAVHPTCSRCILLLLNRRRKLQKLADWLSHES